MCQPSRCSPKRVDTMQCASKDAGPQRGRFSGSHIELEKGTSANKDAEPRKRVDCDIPHWLGRRTKHHL